MWVWDNRLCILAQVCVLLAIWPAQAQPTSINNPVAKALLLELDGVRIQDSHADTPLPPASLTKMMTALLVIERQRLSDEVTISPRAAAATGSRLGLRTGERFLASDLLTAAVVASSNDACRALAEWHSGTEARFVHTMNARAAALGLHQTRFANACGHDAVGHLSTASDLALLARAVMQQAEYAQRAQLPTAEVKSLSGRVFKVSNHNHLIGRFPGAVGVKTGFTQRAGKCLIALARRNGREALLVMLNAPNRWWDADALLEQALRRPGTAP